MKIYDLAKKANEFEFSGAAWHMVMSGIENALEDHADNTPEFERAAMATLESNLCYPNKCVEKDLEFFRQNGVEW